MAVCESRELWREKQLGNENLDRSVIYETQTSKCAWPTIKMSSPLSEGRRKDHPSPKQINPKQCDECLPGQGTEKRPPRSGQWQGFLQGADPLPYLTAFSRWPLYSVCCISQPQERLSQLEVKITKCYFEITHIRIEMRIKGEHLDAVESLWF